MLFCFYWKGSEIRQNDNSGLFLLCYSHSQCGPSGPGMTRSFSPTWWGATQAPDRAGAGHRWEVSQASQHLQDQNATITTLTWAPWATTCSFHFWNPFLGAWSCLSSWADFPSPPSTVLHHIQLPVWQPTHWWESVQRSSLPSHTYAFSTLSLPSIRHLHTANQTDFYNSFPYSPFHLLSTQPRHLWLHW